MHMILKYKKNTYICITPYNVHLYLPKYRSIRAKDKVTQYEYIFKDLEYVGVFKDAEGFEYSSLVLYSYSVDDVYLYP